MSLDISRIRAICFDVDGTLSDTDDLWASRVEQLLHPLFPRRNLRPFARWLLMGLETPGNVMYHVLDRFNLDASVARLYNLFSKLRVEGRPKTFWLIPRVDEMIASLHPRYPLSVVSARGHGSTITFLEQHRLKDYFRAVATSQTCRYTKPFPDPIQWAAGQMGVSPEECLMVGDTTVDIRAGKAAGAQTVGVLCGFGSESELRRAGADLILPTTADLNHVLSQ